MSLKSLVLALAIGVTGLSLAGCVDSDRRYGDGYRPNYNSGYSNPGKHVRREPPRPSRDWRNERRLRDARAENRPHREEKRPSKRDRRKPNEVIYVPGNQY